MPIEDKHEYIYDPCDTLKRFFPSMAKLALDESKMKELYRALKAEVESFAQLTGIMNFAEETTTVSRNRTEKINAILKFAKEHPAGFDSSEVAVACNLKRKYAKVLLDFMFRERRQLDYDVNNGRERYFMKPIGLFVIEKDAKTKEVKENE
jgi:predicted transcriptional regulator